MSKNILKLFVTLLLVSGCSSGKSDKPAPQPKATTETTDVADTLADQAPVEKEEQPPAPVSITPEKKTENKQETAPVANTPAQSATAPVVTTPIVTASSVTPVVTAPVVDIPKALEVNLTPVKPAAVATQPVLAEKKNDEKKAEDFVELTFEETRNFFTVVTNSFGKEVSGLLLEPTVGSQFEAEQLDIQVSGSSEQLNYQLLHKGSVVVEAKNLKLDHAKPNEVKLSPYTLQAVCTGGKCDVLFMALYIPTREKTLAENYPVILKWNGSKYVKATYMDSAAYKDQLGKEENLSEAEKEQLKAKLPPQLRVMALYEKNFEAQWNDTLKLIHERMKKDDSIYSGHFFVNVAPNSFDEVFTRTKDGLNFELKIDFIGADNRAQLNFKSVLATDKVTTMTDKSGVTLDIVPLIKDQFFLMTFENKNFHSYLKNSSRAIISKLCQVLEEDNQIYIFCGDLFSSSYALGVLAIEGRVGGPVVQSVKSGQENNQTVEVPVILEKVETHFEFPKMD